ncbi:MAG: choline transporter [Oceanicaulis sp.]|uniref:BCCT family transporter n=1 Tax=Oceanicaulis sp. TaxID=1924941 RepID=UPI000C6A37BE|nr:BCCT family transporter [Oceanicaulis sp.]MAB68952.1 choline transporter [Oceanicaulis sp.]MBC39672.1 choline transporter [Oceanicaulis sp.]MBG36544.1 choline transporter [Oceanicaulis sp.]HBU63589.1 choline transporter [Oceanicaulis sp.]|tara:strand:+ start:202 stop:2148 length:1947 start_codon:yes stop_codon:yes gene_type:complete
MKKFEPAVFIPAAILIFAGVGYAVLAGDQAETLFVHLRMMITEKAGWVYSVGVGVFLVASVFVALSDWGQIKLGPDDSEPEYGFLGWFAMLFSAGMGIGLMFFAVAEPLTHYIAAPLGDPETVEAAEQAMVLTFFHWGIHAWAVYAIVGLSLAYFAFRHNLPLTIRSALYPLIGDRIYGPIGHAVDVVAILGTLFGVATSLGYGVNQINAGLNTLFDVPISPVVQVVLIGLITALATTSVLAGLDAGIKRLSEWNLFLAIALMLFVFIAGPTLFLIGAYVQNIGDYIDQLAVLTFNVDAYGDGVWVNDWTLFYWGWWISWSPFVGMFIARISRGRTIREFIFGVLFGPTLFTFLWMTIYGNSALLQAVNGMADPILQLVRDGDTPLVLFAFLDTLPFSAITSVLAIILVTTFFVTSSDSGSLVKATLASGGSLTPPLWQRFFWAVLEGVVAAVLLLTGGLAALQSATIAAALPFTLVIFLAFVGLMRAWSMETARRAGAKSAPQLPVEGAAVPWRTRLKLMFSTPKPEDVRAWMKDAVDAAFREIVPELEKQGLSSRVETDEEQDRIWLTIEHGEQPDFVYGIELKSYEDTAVPGSSVSQQNSRGEVFLAEGGQHYCIYGYSKTQVIRDVIRHYERHRQWIHHLVNVN